MKKAMFGVIFTICLGLTFLLTACSTSYDQIIDEGLGNNDDAVLLDASTPDRKIIYSAEATLFVDDIAQVTEEIRSLLDVDEWFDSENVSSTSGYLVVRVKTENLDSFIQTIKSDYKISNYSKSATDISLQYQTAEHKIASYEAERAQLVVLFEGASLSDMITINSRIAAIDLLLGELEGTLNSYDSLVAYSTITLYIRQEHIVSRLPFGTRVVDGFINGVNGLVSFFDGLIILLVNIIPFAIIFIPGGYGIYRWYKHYTSKKLVQSTSNHNKKL